VNKQINVIAYLKYFVIGFHIHYSILHQQSACIQPNEKYLETSLPEHNYLHKLYRLCKFFQSMAYLPNLRASATDDKIPK